MDAQTGLSLGLNSSMPSPTTPSTTPLTDNSSSSFQVNSTPSFSWRLHDKPDKVLLEPKEQKQEEHEQEGETIDFMSSPPVCLKRQMEEQQQQQCFPSKRVAVDWGNQPLSVADPEIHTIMEKEKLRQFKGIELIASENFVCKAVMEALGSHLTNKYYEGMPGAKYYTGNQYIDQLEFLCCERALLAFNLDPNNT